MLISVNHKELFELANNFNIITNAAVAIYDTNFNVIESSQNAMCRFCSEIRSNPIFNQKCIDCDNYALRECARTRKPYIYYCHMNLLEITIPIICNDIVIGYMMFGQITNQKDFSKHIPLIEKYSEEYGFNKELLKESLKEIPYFTDDQLTAISNIMKMAVTYIWSNDIMNITKNSLANNIELYIENHLDEELSVTALCEKFNLSRSALYKLATENFRMGITDYVQHCRLNAAKRLLKTQYHLSIVEVSELVGIRDTSYFARFFKAHTGLTPKQYQLKYKAE